MSATWSEQGEPDLSAVAKGKPVVLFDGVCHLCSGSVQFAIARDPAANLRFAAIQSIHGQVFLRRRGLPTDQFETFYLVEGGRVYEKSAGFLRMAGYLRRPWPLLRLMRIVPRPVRDWLYDRIARNRYRLFGVRQTCLVPTPEITDRFLD
jgi:predicted DCC family thiol-disulfide oxidoreductase YuxK